MVLLSEVFGEVLCGLAVEELEAIGELVDLSWTSMTAPSDVPFEVEKLARTVSQGFVTVAEVRGTVACTTYFVKGTLEDALRLVDTARVQTIMER